MDCWVVFSCAATACWVLSSLDDALQPKANPPNAITPRTTIAGSCQEGLPFSTIVSSDIFLISLLAPEGNAGSPGLKASSCMQPTNFRKPSTVVTHRRMDGCPRRLQPG